MKNHNYIRFYLFLRSWNIVCLFRTDSSLFLIPTKRYKICRFVLCVEFETGAWRPAERSGSPGPVCHWGRRLGWYRTGRPASAVLGLRNSQGAHVPHQLFFTCIVQQSDKHKSLMISLIFSNKHNTFNNTDTSSLVNFNPLRSIENRRMLEILSLYFSTLHLPMRQHKGWTTVQNCTWTNNTMFTNWLDILLVEPGLPIKDLI